MDEFFIALAGGIVGTVATAAWAFLARLLAARNEVAAHDQEVAELREDLETWVADRNVALRRELNRVSARFNARNLFYGSAHAQALARAKERALHEYRDEERRSHRLMMRALESEGWMHAFWRTRDGRPRPDLLAAERAEPILEVWRSSVTRHGTPPIGILDPTKRGLDTALGELDASGTKPYV